MGKQEAPRQDVLKAAITALVGLKNKQTRSSTRENGNNGKSEASCERLQRQTGPDRTRTDRRDRPSWV